MESEKYQSTCPRCKVKFLNAYTLNRVLWQECDNCISKYYPEN